MQLLAPLGASKRLRFRSNVGFELHRKTTWNINLKCLVVLRVRPSILFLAGAKHDSSDFQAPDVGLYYYSRCWFMPLYSIWNHGHDHCHISGWQGSTMWNLGTPKFIDYELPQNSYMNMKRAKPWKGGGSQHWQQLYCHDCSGTTSQVTPQGRHREGSNWRRTVSSSTSLPTWTRHPYEINEFIFTCTYEFVNEMIIWLHWIHGYVKSYLGFWICILWWYYDVNSQVYEFRYVNS